MRLGGERGADVAREREVSGAAITLLIRRLGEQAGREKSLQQKLEQLREKAKC